MTRRWTAPALGAALACAGWGCAASLPPTPGAPVLRTLNIEGNRELSDQDIEARIVTSGTSWWPFAARHYYDEAVLESDLRRLLRLYQAEGFYQARIVERVVTSAGEGRVAVTVRIDEGPPTVVSELRVAGLDDLPERARVLDGLPLRAGARFQEGPYEATKEQIVERLRQAGFAEAQVEGQATVDVPSRSAQIALEATPGLRYRFGEVHVAGPERVPRERLADEAKVVIVPGERYREGALAQAQRRIFDLGVFTTVRVSKGAPDREAATMPIVVAVREAPFHTLRVGAGFALDSRRTELPRVTGEWAHRDFLGGLRRLSVSAEASLVYLPALWALFDGQPLSLDVAAQAGVRFEQPSVLGRNTHLTAFVGAERGVDAAFSYIAGRASLGLLYRSGAFRFEPSYVFSLFQLSGAAAAAVTKTAQEEVLDRCAATGHPCRLAYLEQRMSYDRRDNPTEPRLGAFVALTLQEGTRYVGGGYDYLRLLPEIRGYVPLGPLVLAARVQVGLLHPLSGAGSSVLTRFFLGGANTERGFGNRQLAPGFVACRYRDPLTNACQTAEQAGKSPGTDVTEILPVGGEGMLGGNLELRVPLPASFALVVFADAGEVAPSLGELRLETLHVSVGMGVRYRTVFGPVRLDAAYRVNDPPIALFYATDLPLGAQPAPISRFALQFSIGEAF